MMDLDGTIDSWNEGVKALLGYDEHEFVGMPCVVLFSDEDRDADAPRRELDEALSEGEAQDDRWHVKKNGEHCWINGLVTTIRDERGEPCGFVKIMRDQTDLKRALDRLSESQERFAKAFRSNPSPVAILRLPTGELTDLNDAFTGSFGRSRDELHGRTLAQLLPDDDGVAEDILDDVRAGRPLRRDAAFRRNAHDIGYGSFAFEPVEIGGAPHAVMLMHDVTERRAAQVEIERQKAIVEGTLASLPGIFYTVDGQDAGRLVRWNDDLERVTGYGADELATMRATDLVVASDLDAVDIEAGLEGRRLSLQARLRCKDGTLVPYLFTVHRAALPEGRYVIGVGVSVEEQKRTQEVVLRRARQQAAIADLAARLLDSTEMRDALEPTIEVVGTVLHASDVHVLTLGHAQELVVACATDVGVAQRRAAELGRPPVDRGSSIDAARRRAGEPGRGRDPDLATHADDPDEAGAEAGGDAGTDAGTDAGSDAGSDALGHAHGGLRAVIRTAAGPYGLIEALTSRDHDDAGDEARFLDTIASLLGSAAERHRLHRSLAHEAEHDQLTGLPNRLVIEVQLENAIERAERQNAKVAVALLDLDRFKHVNDSLGHATGDELLARVADRLRESVRAMDTVARLGGDEFVLVIPEIVDEAEAAHVAERVLASFEPPFLVGGRELSVGTTVGIALFPDDGEAVDELLRAADGAMYTGKASGRGTYRFATAERGTKVGERLALEHELHEALTAGQLALAFQPQLDLATDRVVAVEALVRWRHPTRGFLLPEAFLPLAQEIGLSAEIDEWAVREACAWLDAFDDAAASPLRIAVNVAPRHLVQPSFPERMGVLAREAGVAPTRIELEVDESAVLHDPEVVTRHLRELADLGFRLALDDFGRGYAALTLLHTLPFERIKIDGGLVRGFAADDRDAAAFAEIVIEMVARFGLDVVAEGVETAEQRGAAERHGCGYAQGRLFADALSGEELVAFLRSTG